MKQVGIAVAILILPDGRLVLQRRTADAKVAPGKLGFFGGHIEEGESPDEAIVRELAEEISFPIVLDSMKRRGSYILPNVISMGDEITFHVYEADVPDMEFDIFEGEAAEAYRAEEIFTRTDVSRSTQYVIEKVSKQWH